MTSKEEYEFAKTSLRGSLNLLTDAAKRVQKEGRDLTIEEVLLSSIATSLITIGHLLNTRS